MEKDNFQILSSQANLLMVKVKVAIPRVIVQQAVGTLDRRYIIVTRNLDRGT